MIKNDIERIKKFLTDKSETSKESFKKDLVKIGVCMCVGTVLAIVHSFSWLPTEQEVEYMGELVNQGYTYEQAEDEICEIHGSPCVNGTGGIDGINKYGSVAYNGGSSSSGSSNTTSSSTQTHTHTWENEEIIKEPTCTEEGEAQYTCSCGKTKKVTLDKIDHTYATKEETPATCISYRKVTFICSVCSATEEVEFPEEGYADHIYIPTEDSEEPTCTEAGVIHYVCNVCGDAYDEDSPALGHDFTEYTVDKEPTCTETGIKSLHCTRCDEIEEGSEVEIPAKGHAEDPKHEVVNPTFWKAGSETIYCINCGEEMSSTVLPATGGIFRVIIPIGVGILLIGVIVSIIVLKKKGK